MTRGVIYFVSSCFLFRAIETFEGQAGAEVFYFEEEIHDHFDAPIVEAFLAFRDSRANDAASTRVVDFFKAYGYSQRDLVALLPVSFSRKRSRGL